MIEQMQSFHIRYLLDAASKLAGESVVIDSRDGRGAAQSGVSR
jgi:hypothetical protein